MKQNTPDKPNNKFHLFMQTFIRILLNYKIKYPLMPDWQRQEIIEFERIIRGQNGPDIHRQSRTKIEFYNGLYGVFYVLTGATYKKEVIDELNQLLKNNPEQRLFKFLVEANDQGEKINEELLKQMQTKVEEKEAAQDLVADLSKELGETQDELKLMRGDLDFLLSVHKAAQDEKKHGDIKKVRIENEPVDSAKTQAKKPGIHSELTHSKDALFNQSNTNEPGEDTESFTPSKRL